MRMLIIHDEMGIYLGSCMGMGFWSKLDPAAQPAAVTFESIEQAQGAINRWDNPIHDIKFVEVSPSDGVYATIKDCVDIGLDGWDDSIDQKRIYCN